MSYFFDDVPLSEGATRRADHTPTTTDVDAGSLHDGIRVSSAEGFQLVRAFTKITDPRVRKRMLKLVKSLTGEEEVFPDFRVVELREAQRA